MLVSTALTIPEAKEKLKAAQVLSTDIKPVAVGVWLDSDNNPVFCGFGGIEIQAIKTRWVTAKIDGQSGSLRPDSGYIEFRLER